MFTFRKKNTLMLLIVIFLQSCSTAVKVIDTTASTAIKTVTGTIKGIVHITTCPITKKECF